MRSGRNRILAMALRYAGLSVAGAFGLSAALPAAAHADGKVTWQNTYDGRYLEVYQSSTSQGALVGTWPWNGSNTQYWYDVLLSGGPYWEEKNYNSGLPLTAYNTCSQGVTQWPWHTYTTQQWKEVNTGTNGWMIVNRGGCDGDPYKDNLSQKNDNPALYNVYIYRDAYPLYPYWR